MSRLDRAIRMFGACAGVAAVLTAPGSAAGLELPRDGWVSWEVAAVDRAPAWCCWSWRDRHAARASCDLDGNPDGIGMRGDDATTDSIKVYARVAAGKVERLQVLASACPVQTRAPIEDVGAVAEDDSARWLIGQAKLPGASSGRWQPIDKSALAALALHRGNLARDALVEFARGDARRETRKQAVFWLAMLRGEEGAQIASTVMFNDPDADLRQHAAFAMTLSRSPRVSADLIRLGNADESPDVRAKAWFWLAQTGAADAEEAIATALRKDEDEQVREQAVFALSRLPDDRATRALIAIAEDRSLSTAQRKRAVFWLSQSQAGGAQAYLDKVLARNAD